MLVVGIAVIETGIIALGVPVNSKVSTGCTGVNSSDGAPGKSGFST